MFRLETWMFRALAWMFGLETWMFRALAWMFGLETWMFRLFAWMFGLETWMFRAFAWMFGLETCMFRSVCLHVPSSNMHVLRARASTSPARFIHFETPSAGFGHEPVLSGKNKLFFVNTFWKTT